MKNRMAQYVGTQFWRVPIPHNVPSALGRAIDFAAQGCTVVVQTPFGSVFVRPDSSFDRLLLRWRVICDGARSEACE